MTNEEAIEFLKNAPIMGVKVKDSPLPLARAIEVAIDALEKQIPKKPIIKHEKHDCYNHDDYLCPTCAESLFTDCDDAYYNSLLNWCNKCGQAIDWSEEK